MGKYFDAEECQKKYSRMLSQSELLELIRPKGEWIHERYKNHDIWHCSKCNVVVSLEDTILYSYCPYCGAKIRKDNNNGT